MKTVFPIHKFRELPTPFYYYDTKVLRDTLACVNREVARYDNFSVHYAVKANANPKVLTIIRESGLGADCVSGGEIRAAIKAGFPAGKIVFAGVGKADWEIDLGLDYVETVSSGTGRAIACLLTGTTFKGKYKVSDCPLTGIVKEKSLRCKGKKTGAIGKAPAAA